MGLEGARDKKLLYHLIKVKNMEAIINFGLLPRRYLLRHDMVFGDVVDPQISVSGLVLLDIRLNLKRFNSVRLQKTGYFLNLFLEEYFKFDKWKSVLFLYQWMKKNITMLERFVIYCQVI